MTVQLSKLQSAKVLVVGDAMLDRYWHGSVERISPEAPVPVVKVTREEERVGAAANVALNVVTLGGQASFVSVVGKDEASLKLEELLKQTGIATHLVKDDAMQTTVKLRVIGRAQQLIRVDFENTPSHELLSAQTDRVKGLLDSHNAVLFSDYAKGGLQHVAQMIALARAAGKPVLIDPKGSDYSKYKGASVITPNSSELQQVIGKWSNEDELRTRAQNLREALELDALLFTRSEEGMSLYDKEGDLHVKAQAREVFDVTGAGDTVIATLATLVGAGLSLREAMPHANRAGGLVVGKFGTASLSFDELFGGTL